MRKVLITGATSGFGKLMVEAFLENGDYVIASGRSIKERRELFLMARAKFPERFLEVDLDVTKKDEVQSALTTILGKVGHIDILINNAGFGQFGSLEDLSEEEIRNQMEVNFFGLVSVTRAFLPSLRESRGKIFNLSSVFGFLGFPLTSTYCASKFAVEGLTESLRGELGPHGVQVCLIEPGGYGTNFGKSIGWGTLAPMSVYDVQVGNYQKLRERNAKKKTQDPTEVSRGILKLSLEKKLPMRKVFGKDARVGHLLKTLVPDRIYFPFMDVLYRTIFLRR